MRTTIRPLTGTVLAVASLGGIAVASPTAYAGDLGRLEVYPSSAAPGQTVTVNTTACGKNGKGVGDAGSLGAGEFKLAPGTHQEVVIGQFRVPAHAKPGTYAISVACQNGKTATGDLTVTQAAGGGTGGTGGTDIGGKETGGHAQEQPPQQQLPEQPREQAQEQGHASGVGHVPSGPVKTGVGGSVGPDTAQIAAGAAVLAAAAVGGVWLLRRRASGAQGH
ncbi:hypothetical protein AB0A69_00965 [Streptomyces sp. NPDC045431]|uniref:hypothetical protein n=1 Tax=Streptomyces sp. NPDC045431 TaxID=3155613 RepID=UPI0033F39400